MSAGLTDRTFSEDISYAEKLGLFADLLGKGFTLRIRVTGKSMSPFLQGGEILTIKKVACDTLRKGDLIFFKTPENFPVIHRIIEKERGMDNLYTFRTKGDSAHMTDEPVREDDILGKVCRIERIATNCKRRHIDMEIPLWKGINFSLALVSLGKAKLTSYSSLSGLLRRIKKPFV